MAGEAVWKSGTVLNIALATSTGLLATGGFAACADASRQPANDAGYTHAHFELDTAVGGFSVAPTVGATISIYEQKINTGGNLSPAPSAAYKAGYIGSLSVDPVDSQKFLTTDPLAINLSGGKYWIEWADGGAGVASMDVGWLVRMIPTTIGPA